MHRRLFAALASVGVLLLASGCAGYRLGSVKPVEFENITSISVPTFKNDTLEPRANDLVTDAVIKALQVDGTYGVGTTDTADAVLLGTIRRIDRAQLRSARFNTLRSRELRVRMEVDYELEELGTGVILSRGTVRGDTNIFLDANFQLTERQAIYEMSKKLAADLVGRIAEGWPGLAGTSTEGLDQRDLDRDIERRTMREER